MNVLISTDMEGISGIGTYGGVFCEDSQEYQQGLKRLMADTNAAVSAAFDAGAKKVYVVDGHYFGKNFLKGELDKRATQVWVKDLSWVAKDVQAVVAIGSHAMAGTQGAFLDHTQMYREIHHYFYNGERIGELMQMGVFMGHFGVPLVAMSGDQAACEEAKKFFGAIPTACVKVGKERNFAECLPNEEAEKLIYETVKKGVEDYQKFQPYKMPLPFEIKVEYNCCDYCDEEYKNRTDVERINGYTLRSVKKEIKDYYTGVML